MEFMKGINNSFQQVIIKDLAKNIFQRDLNSNFNKYNNLFKIRNGNPIYENKGLFNLQ